MDQAPRDQLLVYLAKGTLEGAAVRVLDVSVLASDAAVTSGFPSRVVAGEDPALVLTAHGAAPGTGEDTAVDLEDAIWAWASASDGTTVMFGEPAPELHALLAQSLEEAKAADKKGEDAGRLAVALGLLSHAMGDLEAAESFYRAGMAVLVMKAPPRASGDVWMKIADVYADTEDWESWKMAIGQAIAAYDLGLGVHHPITTRAKQALAGRA
ncbi:MAG: hypothetical protein KIT84_19420 [Labilithrix sp.]|nr:hypothetical protein [Labilithrix sp.]MCW5813206.1 hypothetical protein [Labilithrix sp.]